MVHTDPERDINNQGLRASLAQFCQTHTTMSEAIAPAGNHHFNDRAFRQSDIADRQCEAANRSTRKAINATAN
jgi:hypothetical protein